MLSELQRRGGSTLPSLAGDLVVFLQSSQEWEILISVCKKYSLASKVRTNVQKEALLSLQAITIKSGRAFSKKEEIV